MRALFLLAREKKKGWCPEPIKPIIKSIAMLLYLAIRRSERLPKQHLYFKERKEQKRRDEHFWMAF
tara:strand:+ start:403 stop:600 length:198 start_codon:yes stop_codon:yes gene_type:complete